MRRRSRAPWRDELQYNGTRHFIGALLTLLLLAGCGLFQTREPESPVGNSGTNPPASSPEMLLLNFKTAVGLKNLQDYEKIFSDTISGAHSFVFVPTAEAAARYSSVFSRWSKSIETATFQNALSSLPSSASPTLTFLSQTVFRFQSDSALISCEYMFLLPHRLTTVTTTFTGRADFYTAPDKNQSWTIYRWVDITTKRDSSWSDCKGAFAQ